MSGDTISPPTSPRTYSRGSPGPAMSVHGPIRPPIAHPGPFRAPRSPDSGEMLPEIPSSFRSSTHSRPSPSRQPSQAPRNSLTSLLNPQPSNASTSAGYNEDDGGHSPRRRKFPRGLPRAPSLPALSQSAFTSSDAPVVPSVGPLDQLRRPVLTPKSPMQRSMSHMNLRGSSKSGLGDIVPVPPLPTIPQINGASSFRDLTSSPHYPSERSMPEAPAYEPQQSQYHSIAAPSTHRPSIGAVARLEQQYRGSATSSPTMSRSSRSQQDLSPPTTASQMGSSLGMPPRRMTQSQSLYSEQATASVPGYRSSHHIEGAQGSSAASNRSQYRVMNLQTSSGVLQLPVDVELASKIANDKRRRNAGASARFRSRRKQREQIAHERIQILEQHTTNLKQAVDFYKAERDYFRDVLRAQSKEGTEMIFQRAASPKDYLDEPKPRSSIDPSVAVRSSSYSPAPSDFDSDSRLGLARHRTMSPRSVPASRSGAGSLYQTEQGRQHPAVDHGRVSALSNAEYDSSFAYSRSPQPSSSETLTHCNQQNRDQQTAHHQQVYHGYRRRSPQQRRDDLDDDYINDGRNDDNYYVSGRPAHQQEYDRPVSRQAHDNRAASRQQQALCPQPPTDKDVELRPQSRSEYYQQSLKSNQARSISKIARLN